MHISMRYGSMSLPYQDAKVASKLCVGGPVKYVLQDGSNIVQAWLLENVFPNVVLKSTMVHRGNKVDGLFELNELNNATSCTAGQGLKTNKTTNKTSGKAKQMKQDALGC